MDVDNKGGIRVSKNLSKRAYVTSNNKVVMKSKVDAMMDAASTQLESLKGEYNTNSLHLHRVAPTLLVDLLETNTYHRRAVEAKAADAAGSGYAVTNSGETKRNKRVSEFENLLMELDEDLNATFKKFFSDYVAIGYACMEVARRGRLSANQIDAVYHVPAHQISVSRDLNRYRQQTLTDVVWFKRLGFEDDVHKTTGKVYPAGTLFPVSDRANELLFASNYSQTDLVYGMSDIVPALDILKGDLYRKEYVNNFFSNFGTPQMAIVISGDIDQVVSYDADGEEVLVDLQEEILAAYEQVQANPSGALVYTIPSNSAGGKVDVKFERLSDEEKEISFREFRKDNRDEVLSAHGVPLSRLGISEVGSLGGNDTEELNEVYMSSVIEPLSRILVDFVNDWWIASLGYEDVRFDIVRRDSVKTEQKMALAKDLFAMGAVTPRQLLNLFGSDLGIEIVESEHLDRYFVNNTIV